MEITPYAKNAKKHPKKQIEQIAASIKEFGMNQPIVVDKNGVIIVGHGRYLALQELGWELKDEWVKVVDITEAQANAYRLADNKLNESDWEMDLVIEELKTLDRDLAELTGFDLNLLDQDKLTIEKGNLSDKFLIPPFSVLNAREGWWQNRKRQWLALGIQSELGRGEGEADKKNTGGLLMKSWTSHPDFYQQKTRKEAELGVKLTTKEFIESHFVPPSTGAYASGTSIFDPVLAELACTWFAPKNANVLDPFAGGSVRGIVASKLGHQYCGTELRAEQVDANRQQANDIITDTPQPVWQADDALNIKTHFGEMKFDLMLSCPPYADLEVYSDDPRDLSNMDYHKFIEVYKEIIKRSGELMKDNSFAVCVVGEVRDKQGNYYDFVGDTVQAYRDAGFEYYNEIILVTAIGSLPIRIGKQFSSTRKIGKTHQNVLVFVKGDGRAATTNCGEIEVHIPEEVEESDLI